MCSEWENYEYGFVDKVDRSLITVGFYDYIIAKKKKKQKIKVLQVNMNVLSQR